MPVGGRSLSLPVTLSPVNLKPSILYYVDMEQERRTIRSHRSCQEVFINMYNNIPASRKKEKKRKKSAQCLLTSPYATHRVIVHSRAAAEQSLNFMNTNKWLRGRFSQSAFTSLPLLCETRLPPPPPLLLVSSPPPGRATHSKQGGSSPSRSQV